MQNSQQKIISVSGENVSNASSVSGTSRKIGDKNQKNSGNRMDEDVFIDVIVDELKKENRDLKFALVARNQRLEDAAVKVTQLIEQNTYLTQKVERAALDHTEQAKDLIEAQKR